MIQVKEFIETIDNTGRCNDIDSQINAFLMKNKNVVFVDIKYTVSINESVVTQEATLYSNRSHALLIYRI